MAKEIVLDALHGSRALRSLIDDINEWCPCGPGARRGLKRIFGRQTSLFVEDNDVESAFISEMASLLSEAQKRMPGWCKDMDIELHDIQFQLCEFDKYERIRQSERGWVARYVPIEKRQPPKKLPLLSPDEVALILKQSKYHNYFPSVTEGEGAGEAHYESSRQ